LSVIKSLVVVVVSGQQWSWSVVVIVVIAVSSIGDMHSDFLVIPDTKLTDNVARFGHDQCFGSQMVRVLWRLVSDSHPTY
jgi:hypothetical protein